MRREQTLGEAAKALEWALSVMHSDGEPTEFSANVMMCRERLRRAFAVSGQSEGEDAADNADLRAQLAALQTVAQELIAERDRAVAELERVAQMSLIGEGAA